MRKSRRKAREFALKALYAWLLSAQAAEILARDLRDEDEYSRIDERYFLFLLNGVIEHVATLDLALRPYLDRDLKALSPIEHALLLIGAFETWHAPDVPYKVVINEAVELAKAYGGTDGHKYINGVLDKLMPDARPHEGIPRKY